MSPRPVRERFLEGAWFNVPDTCKALWQDPSLTPKDKAKGACYAMLQRNFPLAAWMLDQSDLNTDELVLMKTNVCRTDTFDGLLCLLDPNISKAAVLKAVIARRLQVHSSTQWFETLAKDGSQELVLNAIDSNYAFEPSFLAKGPFMKIVDQGFIACLAERNIATIHLSLALAVKRKDLQLLNDTLADDSLGSVSLFFLQIELSREALYRGWASGAELLLGRFGCPDTKAPLLLEAAMKGSSRACLDLLLGQGPAWKMTAVTQAMVGGHFEALEHALQNGGLPQGGGRLQFLGSRHPEVYLKAQWFAPQQWETTMGNMVKGAFPFKSCPLARRDSVMAFFTAYVVSLLDPQAAQHLGPEVSLWRSGILSLLTWWDKQAQAWAQNHPQGGCHCPEVIFFILISAGLSHPNLWSRARELVKIIRGWTQVNVAP
eukprot:jgi/Botrbrau1/19178/Bobra.0077s0087.1